MAASEIDKERVGRDKKRDNAIDEGDGSGAQLSQSSARIIAQIVATKTTEPSLFYNTFWQNKLAKLRRCVSQVHFKKPMFKKNYVAHLGKA